MELQRDIHLKYFGGVFFLGGERHDSLVLDFASKAWTILHTCENRASIAFCILPFILSLFKE